MEPQLILGNVRARCPDCDGAITTFELRGGSSPGSFLVEARSFVASDGQQYSHRLYTLLQCAGCGRGGLAGLYANSTQPQSASGMLIDFYPVAVERLSIPVAVPHGIANEFREAELCASSGAWRAASAMLRSTLEKVLKANGYVKRQLAANIDDAGADGVITEPRRKRAHDDIRSLGNDVLHDEWREITQEEVEIAHGYVQRILEDFYDDRPTVAKILTDKGRLTPDGTDDGDQEDESETG